MIFSWDNKWCILCLDQTELSEEHVIPKHLGGRLTCDFLCGPCNKNLGHRVESSVKDDPRIRLALENLRDQIPDLYEALRQGQSYIVKSDSNTFRADYKNDSYRISLPKQEDGSIIYPTHQASSHLRQMMRRASKSEAEIDNALALFSEAPNGKRIQIAEDIEIKKFDITPVVPDLKGDRIGDLFPLKIAYEYLALYLGSEIYRQDFDDTRRILIECDSAEAPIHIEHLRTDTYEPLHRIVIEPRMEHIVVQIRLFGWIVFRVHFTNLCLNGPFAEYGIDLRTDDEKLDPVV